MGREKEALASRSFRCVAHRHPDDVAVLVADHRAIEATPARDIDPFRHVPVPAGECRPRRRVLRLRHSGPNIARPVRTVNWGWVRRARNARAPPPCAPSPVSWVTSPYPPPHRPLRSRISAERCVLSAGDPQFEWRGLDGDAIEPPRKSRTYLGNV